jgi:hypothetical protein
VDAVNIRWSGGAERKRAGVSVIPVGELGEVKFLARERPSKKKAEPTMRLLVDADSHGVRVG